MATAYEKIRQRKIIYLGLILVLLAGSWLHRTTVIEAAATKYDLNETNLGKVELGGSISRFVLSSFRGPLVCGLWWDAIDQQKKHNFEQLELLIKALVKLQPHYKNPWRFQAWNLAFNVSVEFDRAQDKYFYISKGMRWLANGEETNRLQLWDDKEQRIRVVGDPEMRQEIAQYVYDKMYYSDEQSIFRPFLHMSCIPQAKRNPAKLRNNPGQLADFKARYKRFVRRVRDYYLLPDGDDEALDRNLLAFLEEHKDVPCLWKDSGDVQELADDPWPRWPNMREVEFLAKVQDNEEYQDGVDIARTWYVFSTEPLPPPRTELSEDVTPTSDKFHRTNRNMHSMIFRSNPARATCIMGQELDREGWPVDGRAHWERGHQAWLMLGRSTNIDQPEQKLIEMQQKVNYYFEKYKPQADNLAPPPEFLKDENPDEYKRAYAAYRALIFLNNFGKLRQVCRYNHWVSTSDVSATEVHQEAERSKYIARRRTTDWPVAREQYERAIALYCLLIRQPLPPEQELSLRLTMLAPGVSSLLAQITPSVSARLTPFGLDETTQEALIDLEEDYQRVLARVLAPARMRAEQQTWVLRQALAAATLPVGAPTACLPPNAMVPTTILNLGWIEDIIETGRGPFDEFVSPQIRADMESARPQRVQR